MRWHAVARPGDRGHHSREYQVREAHTSITDKRMVGVLERLAALRALPLAITVDHGVQFEGPVLDAWRIRKRSTTELHPSRQARRERLRRELQRHFHDECLNEHWVLTMAQARRAIEDWRIEYNTERPHAPSAI